MYIGKHPTPCQSSLLVLLFDFSSISPGQTQESFNLVMVSSLWRFLRINAQFLRINEQFLGSPDIEKLTEGSGSECLDRVLVSSAVGDRHFITDQSCRSLLKRIIRNFSLGLMNTMRRRIYAFFPMRQIPGHSSSRSGLIWKQISLPS